MSQPPECCPNCGAEVPANAKACPECGSDEQTGWSERAEYGRLGVPDPEFNYGEFVQEEFGEPRSRERGLSWWWWVAAVLLLAALLGFLL